MQVIAAMRGAEHDRMDGTNLENCRCRAADRKPEEKCGGITEKSLGKGAENG